MIKINELRITPDSKYLLIDVEVDGNLSITSIHIDNDNTFIVDGPSEEAYSLEEESTNITEKLSAEEIECDLNKDMIFVYFTIMDEEGIVHTELKTVINPLPIYREAINGLKGLNKECSIHKEFINNILRFKAVELSVKTGNSLEAIRYWKKYFKDNTLEITKE